MTRVFKPMLMVAAALAGYAVALPAGAQFAKAEDAIKYRRASFTLLGTHFGRVAAMANGRVPFDAKAAAANAEIAAFAAPLAYAGFVEGSDKGDTRALPKIWSERDKFNAAATRMQEEITKLNAVAKTGNLDNLRAQTGEVGKACKACHDDYRKD